MMQLLVLYGPPASGKLTIAKELSQKLDYPILHNHLFFNIAHSLYDLFSENLNSLYDELNAITFNHAAANGIAGIITTVCSSDARKKKLFTELLSGSKEITVAEGRSGYGKLTDVQSLQATLSSKDFDSVHTGVCTVSVDSTNDSPCELAGQIINSLNRVGEIPNNAKNETV